MSRALAKSLRNYGLSLGLMVLACPVAKSQNKVSGDNTVVRGVICDSKNRPLPGAMVYLENAERTQTFVTRSDSEGHYRFAAVADGRYTVRASKDGFRENSVGPFGVHQPEAQIPILHLGTAGAPPSSRDGLSAVQFSDEPSFTVAGVRDPSNLGGHGSDTPWRAREALARDAASLNHEDPASGNGHPRDAENVADVHARIGDVAEAEGRPLDAVREYQRAAELEPSEAHLFAWAAELLLHRAFLPAIEVFAKGHQQFPASSRMLVGLGVATYDQGSTEQGKELLLEACNAHPADATPYLFLGRLQEAETTELPGWAEKLQQFVKFHPENPMAHYYLGIALARQRSESEDFAAVESELRKALQIDPHLGEAYLQLGILYSAQKNIPDAASAFQKAIEVTPLPDEAHYRLAELYRQSGHLEKARKEMELYREASRTRARDAEASRHEIQQFIYTLRGSSPVPATPESTPQ